MLGLDQGVVEGGELSGGGGGTALFHVVSQAADLELGLVWLLQGLAFIVYCIQLLHGLFQVIRLKDFLNKLLEVAFFQVVLALV